MRCSRWYIDKWAGLGCFSSGEPPMEPFDKKNMSRLFILDAALGALANRPVL